MSEGGRSAGKSLRRLLTGSWLCTLAGAIPIDPNSAVFCSYDCSPFGRLSRPGSCYQPSQVLNTSTGWLELITRSTTGPGNIKPFTPWWSSYVAGNMTWEAWFRFNSPPTSRRSLMGTSGPNHDTDYYSLSNRRRYGAVFLEQDGSVSLTSNVGSSSGVVKTTKTIADGRWHHVAAVFSDRGAQQISFSFLITGLLYDGILGVPAAQNNLESRILQIAQNASGASPSEVFLTSRSGNSDPLKTFVVYTVTINAPDGTAPARKLRMQYFSAPTIVQLINASIAPSVRGIRGVFFGTPAVTTRMIANPADNFTNFTISQAGSATLIIDGYAVPRQHVYSPGSDALSMDSMFVVGGGYQSLPLPGQLSRLRLWNIPIQGSQFQQLWTCDDPPLAQNVFGGSFPFGLIASYSLQGLINNTAGTSFPNWKTSAWAQFDIGGDCGFVDCPSRSPEGCLLIEEETKRFNSMAQCQAFATFNFCRAAGANRERPPYLSGC